MNTDKEIEKMSERKIIKQVSVDAKIYDLSVGEKTGTILSEDPCSA